MSFAQRGFARGFKRSRVNYGLSGLNRYCKCGEQYEYHRPKGGACYAVSCGCQAFENGVNPNHRNQVVRASPQEYGGRMYQSKGEANYAAQLDWRKKAADIDAWDYHPLLRIEFNGVHVCDYEVDFLVYLRDKRREYVEIKGYIADTPLWRLKWKMAKAMFKNDPNVVLTLIRV